MGEAHAPEGFEPEVTFTTFEGRVIRLRLDFDACVKLKQATKKDVLGSQFQWAEIGTDLWPRALAILSVERLEQDDARKILHPGNADRLVRAWNELWRIFTGATGDEARLMLDRLLGFPGIMQAPDHVQEATTTVATWLQSKMIDQEQAPEASDAEGPPKPEEPTG